MRLLVERPGPRTLLQDGGRPGLAHLGVSAGGAFDRAAWHLGNRLVGNQAGAASLELLMGQLALRAVDGDMLVALTGAEAPLTVAGRGVDVLSPVLLREGELLEVGVPVRGLRSYLAVRGGLEGRRVFGSLSSDPTRQMGPAPLQAGQELLVGTAGREALLGTDLAVATGGPSEHLELGATWGPREDWFAPEARALLARGTWQMTSESDRVGARLDGPRLTRAVTEELASEAVVRGAVQVPTSGLPLVFGPDHPTTGGYPVIAVVDGPDADRLAQARPGCTVGFRPRRSRLELRGDRGPLSPAARG
ncbi:biotin-dependent carboxyltransferase family protein [Luteococcus peritonei]|uniref:Biotin-dependent carboxyltransferase family protein n=1 Tax=Luteococcus peritonei TaxID=88874 RepID=A0ABW4RZ42_9ACTN